MALAERSDFGVSTLVARGALPHPKYLFKTDEAVVHFKKHSGSIMNATGNKNYRGRDRAARHSFGPANKFAAPYRSRPTHSK